MSPIAPLILGTAQFGHGYGITNTRGRLSSAEVETILTMGTEAGVISLDSALAYGDAERRIGAASRALRTRWHVTTKITLDDLAQVPLDTVVGEARERLQAETLSVLLHRPADLHQPTFPRVLEALRELRQIGMIDSFGVSIYDKAELDAAVKIMPDMNAVQIPGSVVDRRLLDHRTVAELARSGVRVHVRSLFLQGILLLAPEDLPTKFESLAPVLHALDQAARALATSRLALLLASIRTHPAVSGVVVGATSVEEWAQILAAPNQLAMRDIELPVVDPVVLDPRRWN